MRYLSLFSGMEAAGLAWKPLGWQCVGVAEIDPSACAVLGHRLAASQPKYLPEHVPVLIEETGEWSTDPYPRSAYRQLPSFGVAGTLPNLGDVSQAAREDIAALGRIDVVIGGSPCQDLSVAGKRAGLAGVRSGLFHEQVRIFDAARTLCGARWLVWENVPGAFSSNKGRDFALVVGQLAGCELDVPGDGWGNEGVALGDNGLVEWAVLDAQWFGVAQRRRRVFAVLDTGNWVDRSPVLLERDSLRGDSAPRREAGEGATVGTLGGTSPGGGWRFGADEAAAGQLIPQAFGGNNTSGPIEVGTALNACSSASGRLDFESETFLAQAVAGTLNANGKAAGSATQQDAEAGMLVPVCEAYTLAIRGRGDQSVLEYRQDGTANALLTPSGGRGGINVGAIAIAFGCKDSDPARGLGEDVAPTLRAMQHDGSHANAGGQVAVAFAHQAGGTQTTLGYDPDSGTAPCLSVGQTPAIAFAQNQRDEVRQMDVAGALAAEPGMKQQTYLQTGMQVRRLTPRECERLQGAPDDWTLVPNAKGKPMADGPRYKMLGNSFAVPVIAWIGRQIQRAHSCALRAAA